jgi:hypothetical protein
MGRRNAVVAVFLAAQLTAASQVEDYAEPYRILREANLRLDPALAASAYADSGVLIFEQAGKPSEMFQGKEEIRQAYVRTFGQVDPGTPIELNFRFKHPGLVSDRQSGAYSLVAKVNGRPITLHGSFTVELVKQDGQWRFAEDRGSQASRESFASLEPVAL